MKCLLNLAIESKIELISSSCPRDVRYIERLQLNAPMGILHQFGETHAHPDHTHPQFIEEDMHAYASDTHAQFPEEKSDNIRNSE